MTQDEVAFLVTRLEGYSIDVPKEDTRTSTIDLSPLIHQMIARMMSASQALQAQQAASADDIRAAGWNVAIHNDYSHAGENWTFWLFTNSDGRWIKGEGRSDAEALTLVRAALAELEDGK